MSEDVRLEPIGPAKFVMPAFARWTERNFLLTAGDYEAGRYNVMTVGWGFFGVLWAKPTVMVPVRPQRHTLKFLEEFDTFTLCALPESYREAVLWCGRHSGADGTDKFAASGLTAAPATVVAAPVVQEAELLLECRKSYVDQLRGKNFPEKSLIRAFYPEGDFHVLIFGEVLAIRGTAEYRGA